MLILSRTPGESIYISDNIRLTVIGIDGRQIKIGIDAPRDVPVHREEVYNLIKQGKGKFIQQASSNGDGSK